MPSGIPVCMKQNTGTPLRFPLVRGLAADKRLVTIAVTPYKTDTLIQFGAFMLFIDNATSPNPSTLSLVRWGGGRCWQPRRQCGGVQAATRNPPTPPIPASPSAPSTPSLQDLSLRAFTMKSTRTRNLTRCSTPVPIRLQTCWKSVTCFRLFTPPLRTTAIQPAQWDLFLVHAGKRRIKNNAKFKNIQITGNTRQEDIQSVVYF